MMPLFQERWILIDFSPYCHPREALGRYAKMQCPSLPPVGLRNVNSCSEIFLSQASRGVGSMPCREKNEKLE